jgi:hypothetical protein
VRRLGERGIVPLHEGERPLVTQALWRLLLICAVAAAGETIAYQLEWYNEVVWVGVLFGAGAYIFTQDLDRPGRRIEDDDDPRRLN